MKNLVKLIGFSLSLAVAIALLILLPGYLFGVLKEWQIAFLAVSYFVFFLATIVRAIAYGQFAKRSDDRQVKSLFGRLAMRIVILGLGSVHWLAIYDYSHLHSINNNPVDLVINIVAIFLVIASIIINQIAVKTLGEFFDRLIIQPEHQLIKTGIYSRIRHPIYLSYILLFAGFCLAMQSIIGFGLLIVVCGIWFENRIAIEETMLIEEFGEKYLKYQQESKKLFPFIY